MLKIVGINGCYRYSQVSFLANQSGTTDNFVSIFIGDEVFYLGNEERNWHLNDQGGKYCGDNKKAYNNSRFNCTCSVSTSNIDEPSVLCQASTGGTHLFIYGY